MELKRIYDKALNWVLDDGPNLLFGILLFIIGLWLINYLRAKLIARMSRRQVHSSLQPFFQSLVITSLYVLLIIFVMTIVGFQLTIFTTLIGAFGVAAGLALSGTLQNFAGGVLILLLKPFELGDNIVAQGQDGFVTSIQIFYTVLLTLDNKTVIIPNGKLFNEVIVNISREGSRRLDVELKLGYAADPDQVLSILHNAVGKTASVLPVPAPITGIVAMEIDGVKFSVRVWVAPPDYWATLMSLEKQILNDLRAAAVKLPGT
jgi:small conductance mechanosensitive channel